MKVESILAGKGHVVHTIGPEAALDDLVKDLAERRVGALVVTDRQNGRIVGIVSERDVVRAVANHGPGAGRLKVRDAMTADVRTCVPEDDINTIMAVMTRYRLRHLPVMADGKLVGIVSIGDIVKHRLDELGEEVTMWRELFTH